MVKQGQHAAKASTGNFFGTPYSVVRMGKSTTRPIRAQPSSPHDQYTHCETTSTGDELPTNTQGKFPGLPIPECWWWLWVQSRKTKSNRVKLGHHLGRPVPHVSRGISDIRYVRVFPEHALTRFRLPETPSVSKRASEYNRPYAKGAQAVMGPMTDGENWGIFGYKICITPLVSSRSGDERRRSMAVALRIL